MKTNERIDRNYIIIANPICLLLWPPARRRVAAQAAGAHGALDQGVSNPSRTRRSHASPPFQRTVLPKQMISALSTRSSAPTAMVLGALLETLHFQMEPIMIPAIPMFLTPISDSRQRIPQKPRQQRKKWKTIQPFMICSQEVWHEGSNMLQCS